MKEINKKEFDLLIRKNIIKDTTKGFVDRNGNTIGFYRTKNKRYIEDKYSNIAKNF